MSATLVSSPRLTAAQSHHDGCHKVAWQRLIGCQLEGRLHGSHLRKSLPARLGQEPVASARQLMYGLCAMQKTRIQMHMS